MSRVAGGRGHGNDLLDAGIGDAAILEYRGKAVKVGIRQGLRVKSAVGVSARTIGGSGHGIQRAEGLAVC